MGALWIEFAGLGDALAWRSGAGGWLFLVDGAPAVIWFERRFTPSEILGHRVTQGLSGALV
jgi:hypothetical protein